VSDLFYLSFVIEKHNGDGPLKDKFLWKRRENDIIYAHSQIQAVSDKFPYYSDVNRNRKWC